MGGTHSTSTIKQLNDIAISVANKSVQSCVNTAMQSQLIKIKGVKGDVKITGLSQRQGATVDMKCVFSSETQNKLQTDIAQEITNYVKAKGGDITAALGGTSAKQNTDIKNIFQTSIHNETLANQVSSTVQTQTLSAEDIDGSLIIADLSQDQTAGVIAEAIISSSQYTGVLTNIATAIDAHAESQGGGIFTSLFAMFSSIAMYAMYAAVLLVLAVIMFYGGRYVLRSTWSGSVKRAVRGVKGG
jgi:hypothetical protein